MQTDTRARLDQMFVRHPARAADLAFVFGSHLPEEAARRARHAAKLHRDGLVPRLLFSGGQTNPTRPAESVAMAEVAMAVGVPAAAVVVETVSRTTFENAYRCRELLDGRGELGQVRTALLVSCAWHMGRIGRVMKEAFPGLVWYCCPQEESCTAENWHTCDEWRARVEHEAVVLGDMIRHCWLPAEL